MQSGGKMKTRILAIMALLVVFAWYAELEAYGHGLGARFNTAYYRIENEAFSKTTVSVGESFFINGTLSSLVERDIQGKMDVRFDYANMDSWFVSLLKSNFLCLVQEMCTKPILVPLNQNRWYMDIKSEPDAYVLEGDKTFSYSIEMIPLKSGIYHIHTDPNADISSLRYIGPGQTVVVEGSQDVTEGELFEFYIPYSIGFVLVIIGMGYGVVFIYRRKIK